jgi:hypothetical protein
MAGIYSATLPGAREDLADFLAIADIGKNVALASIPRGKQPTNVLGSWLADSYSTPRYTGVMESADAKNFEQIGIQARLYNYCQRLWRLPMVSEFAQELMDQAGVGQMKLMARQITKSYFQIYRDLEAAILTATVTLAADNGTTVPYTMRGLGQWASAAAQSDNFPVDPAYRPNALQNNTTAMGSLTEIGAADSIECVTKSIFDNGSHGMFEGVFLVGSTLKKTVTNMLIFNTNQVRRVDQAQDNQEIVNKVDIIENEFARLEVKLSPFIGLDRTAAYQPLTGYIIDPKMTELRYRVLPRATALPNLGAGPRAIVDLIATLCVKNPLTMASFLATS